MAERYKKSRGEFRQWTRMPSLCHAWRILYTWVAFTLLKYFLMSTFFDVVIVIVKLFSDSIKKWEIISKNLSKSLKIHSDTRWASEYNVVNAFYYLKLLEHLEEIESDPAFCDCLSTVQSLLKQIVFKFVCYPVLWGNILNHFSKVSDLLQRKDVAVAHVSRRISGLKKILFRVFVWLELNQFLKKPRGCVRNCNWKIILKNRRPTKQKRVTMVSTERQGSLWNVLDDVHLDWRLTRIINILDDFGVIL